MARPRWMSRSRWCAGSRVLPRLRLPHHDVVCSPRAAGPICFLLPAVSPIVHGTSPIAYLEPRQLTSFVPFPSRLLARRSSEVSNGHLSPDMPMLTILPRPVSHLCLWCEHHWRGVRTCRMEVALCAWSCFLFCWPLLTAFADHLRSHHDVPRIDLLLR